jgi:hypothetical protein
VIGVSSLRTDTPAAYEFDVFLSHHNKDKPLVSVIAKRLERTGLRLWFDEWEFIPGRKWQEELERALGLCASCAVFLGPNGLGPWQGEEVRSLLDEHVADSDYRIIPVLLAGTDPDERRNLPRFLRNRGWVDLRKSDDESFRRLVAAIRGEKPGHLDTRDALFRKLTNGDSLGRQAAAVQLASLGDSGVIALIEGRWKDEEDPTVRHFLALAIGDLDGDEAVAALARLAACEGDPFALLGIEIAQQNLDTKGVSS